MSEYQRLAQSDLNPHVNFYTTKEESLMGFINIMNKKTWQRRTKGIWQHSSGMLYERPTIGGRRTFRSLHATNLKGAKKELHRRRMALKAAWVAPITPQSATSLGQVIERYAQDGYPDRQRQPRPERMHKAEAANCKTLLAFWSPAPVESLTIAACDRYHDWRVAKVSRGTGHRTVDLELNTLRNSLLWACRCELIRQLPLKGRWLRYRSERSIRHCRQFMPHNAEELHALADLLFSHPRSEVLGWQALFEAVTGLRTAETLILRKDAKPYEPGWITPDGKSLCVLRAKGQGSVSPFIQIHDELRTTLEAFLQWHRKRHPDALWFFPSPRVPGQAIDGSALSHALVRLRPKLGRKITSHGMRAFYVTVRRSHGVPDVQIAWEIGHTSGGATLGQVYGGVPPHWLAGNGPKMSWLPAGQPAWAASGSLERLLARPRPARRTGKFAP